MDEERIDEAQALMRARAALHHAKKILEAETGVRSDREKEESSRLPDHHPSARHGDEGGRERWLLTLILVLAICIAGAVIGLALGYRARVGGMARELEQMQAVVSALQEQQKSELELYSRRVDELTKELDAARKPETKPPRKKFLGIF